MTQTPILWSLLVSIALTVSSTRAEEMVRVDQSSVRSSTDTMFIPDEQRREKRLPALPQGELPPPPPPSAPKP